MCFIGYAIARIIEIGKRLQEEVNSLRIRRHQNMYSFIKQMYLKMCLKIVVIGKRDPNTNKLCKKKF